MIPEAKWHLTFESLREIVDEKPIQKGEAWANRKTRSIHGTRKVCKTETIKEAMAKDRRRIPRRQRIHNGSQARKKDRAKPAMAPG